MSSDQTQQQSSQQLKSSQELSRAPRTPPLQVDGYAIETLLGSGAYGEVWSAVDRKTGRRVAIKYYTRKTSLDVSLLSREVEKLVYLSADRYVVQLLDVGWEAQPPYYVMDYIDNGSLEDELNRRNTLPVDEAVELIEEICIGLMHLHGKGILHCDLKPGNVLLDQDKKPRLADFGQSRLSHEQAPALGTLYFMAPEQADLNALPDAKWDVYALGALLYCMLTGHPPFRDETTLEDLESSTEIENRLQQYRQLIERSPKPTAHRKVPGVDRSLAETIDRCIARNPKHRFASVESVLQALRQRDLAHARRPLIILGVLGPLILLVITSLLARNAYEDAISRSDESIIRKSLESNQFAAQLAARSAAEQIDRYFRVVMQLAEDNEFTNKFAEVVGDEQTEIRDMISQLADPHQNDNESLDGLRQEFIEHPLRQQLQNPLLKNLRDASYPTAASWFLCDHTGTQVASVFNRDDPLNTIGKNYAYRTYFTGRKEIARQEVNGNIVFDVAEDINDREHITRPNMSAIFQSRATNMWKIAFSAPIFKDGKFIGIVAVTADMGSFIEFDNAQNQYVMLVDGRVGDYRGTVLEHKLLNDLSDSGTEITNYSRRKVNEIVLKSFDDRQTDIVPFPDPMSDDEMGKEYDKLWLASWANVIPKISSLANNTGNKENGNALKAIAVENLVEALKPSRQLGQQLVRRGGVALLFFLLVTSGLLFVVSRSVRKSRERANRILSTLGESSSLHDRSTLLAPSSGSSTQKKRDQS